MAKSLKIDSGLWKRVEQHAVKAGYSSPEEFVGHLIEQELARLEDEEGGREVERRLGIGLFGMTSGMIGWSLVAIGVAWGLLAYRVFRRFTDLAAVRRAGKRLYAHLLEIRLFSEEPALVWSSQKALVVDNLRFLGLIARPVLIMALPFAFLYAQLDSIYGWGPLVVGRSAVVTVQLPRNPGADDTKFILHVPPGIAVETPPVRAFAERQISWRIRPQMPVRGNLRVTLPGGSDVSGSIAAGNRTLSFYRRREPSPGLGFFRPAAWVEVDYPKTNVAIAGLELPWLAWFLIVSTASAAVFAIWPGRKAF